MPSHQLCTTALTKFWNFQAEKTIFLGAWCLRYDRREAWQKLHYEVLPYPWDDREAMHKAALYEEDISEQLSGVLGDFLNKVHNETHTKEYWRIILIPWLIHYVQVIHERYLCLKLALDRYPNLKTIGLAPTSFKVPRHYWDHLIGSTRDPYNLQIYTSIFQAMGYDLSLRNFDWDWNQSVNAQKISTMNRVIKKIYSLFREYHHCWANKAPVLMVDIYIPLKQIIQLMIATRFSLRWNILPGSELWVENISNRDLHIRRNDLKNLRIGSNDPFVSILIKTLPANFPLAYLEGYHRCRKWAQETCKRSATQTLVTATAFEINDTFKFLAAELKERQAKLIGIQHGAAYGCARYKPFEIYEKKASDEFWSWGWGKNEPGVIPMPNPKLSSLANKRKSAKRKQRYIFYAGNSVPRYHFRTWSCPIAGQFLQYIEWQINFINMLDLDILNKLIFRPHPIDWGWCLPQRLNNACPDLNMDSSNNCYSIKLIEATLVICDMNQSTFTDSLVANIPTIAFWDPHLSEIRTEAESYFQILHEAGILHYSPQDAANSVNTLWPQVEDWWSQREVQQAREIFTNRFALHSPKWLKKWSNGLKKYLQYK